MSKYVEVRSSVRNLHWDIVTILCRAGWSFVETIQPEVTSGYVSKFRHILKSTTSPVTIDGDTVTTDLYLMVEHANYPGNGTTGNYKTLTFKIAPNYYLYDEDVKGTLDTKRHDIIQAKDANNVYKVFEYPSLPVTLSYIESGVTDASVPFKLDVPINVWGYAGIDGFNFVIHGEPSISTNGYGRVGHVYVGKIDSYKEGKIDLGGNFIITGSCGDNDKIVDTAQLTRYGTYTSDGVGSIAAYRTYGGMLWQKHYASIIFDDSNGNTQKSELYQPSAWTGKFHLSPIYVFHPTDGKRGMLKDVLVVQKQGILHLDELEIVRPVDECNPCPKDSSNNLIDANDTAHPQYETYWKREKYKYYRITSTNHFLDTFDIKTATTGIGLAIKMESDTVDTIKFNTAYDIITGTGINSWTGLSSVPKLANGTNASTASVQSNQSIGGAGVTI